MAGVGQRTKCWMCGQLGLASAEHLLQGAAIDLLFPNLSLENPVQWTAWGGDRQYTSRRLIASSDNDRLSFRRSRICVECNGTRTRAGDEAFVTFFRQMEPVTARRRAAVIPFAEIFHERTEEGVRQLHGHFAKKMGCMIDDVGAGLDLTHLAAAALHQQPDPYLFIGFYSVPTDPTAKLAGASPLNVASGPDGAPRVAEMTLYFESLAIRLIYFSAAVALLRVPASTWRPDDQTEAWTVEVIGA